MFGWIKRHWKTIATVAAAVVVGVAVTALVIATAPVSLPALLVTTGALAAGGFAGGVTGYYVGHWLNDKPTSVRGALVEGTVSAVVSVATLGLGRAIAPAVSRVVAPVVARVAPRTAAPLLTTATTNAASFATAGAVTGAGQQVTSNVMNGRPLGENVATAAGYSALVNGTLTFAGEYVQAAVLRPRLPSESVSAPRGPPRNQQGLIDAEIQPGPNHLYRQDRIFKDYLGPGSDIPPEGWKLHVSASKENAGEIAAIVLPELRRMNVMHKVVGTVDDYVNRMTGTQEGKFITIYPQNPQAARQIVDRIDPLLRGRGLKGPIVPEERMLGDSGLIFTRYGGFTKSTVTNPNGVEVPDVRGQIAPAWVADPFAGPASAPPPPAVAARPPSNTMGFLGALDASPDPSEPR